MARLSALLATRVKDRGLGMAEAATRAGIALPDLRAALTDNTLPSDGAARVRLADFLGISLVALLSAGDLPLEDAIEPAAPPGDGETGLLLLFSADRQVDYNREFPYLLRTGRLVIGATRGGDPAVIGLARGRLGWTGLVHDMYIGASDDELREQSWNVVWVARSLADYVAACRAGRMPIDGCAAATWAGQLGREV
jgi:hypothetical protein